MVIFQYGQYMFANPSGSQSVIIAFALKLEVEKRRPKANTEEKMMCFNFIVKIFEF